MPPDSEKEEKERAEDWLSEIEPDVAVDLRKALLGGILATIVAGVGSTVVGNLYGAEGRLLLEAMLPTTRFLCSSMMTATATILALMLTILSLSSSSSNQIHSSHYKRVQQIALLDMIAFVGATLLLLVLNVPLEESDSLSTEWYNTSYYVILIYSSALGGMLISIVVMLYAAIRDMISVVGLQNEDHPLYQGIERN
jgi:hypothetical protein